MSSPFPQWRESDAGDPDRRGRDRHNGGWHNDGWHNDGRNDRGRHDHGWHGHNWYGSDWREDDRDSREDSSLERRRGPVRIGDTERDQAVAILSDHFVAGRLTQTEFEERSEQATRARYVDDLEPLFDDLPDSAELEPAQGPWSPRTARRRRRQGHPPAFAMLAPILMIALVITAITLTAPWLLWGLFWIALFSGVNRRRYHYQNRHR